MAFDFLIDVFLTWAAVIILFTFWKRFIKRKKAFVIDDDRSDLMLYKVNLNLPEYDVQYFDSVKNLGLRLGIEKPDIVIVDYFLQDNVNGDQVYQFCKRNGIKCILATSYDGDILGVAKRDILRKTSSPEFYRHLEAIVRSKAA